MTRASAQGGARFRQRKLSTKSSLKILREDQVEKIDDEAQRNIPKVDTGVEKAEELEHHLQAAISASHAAAVGGKVAQSYIPTPDAIASSIQYDELYPPRFKQPATYIRFSSTVEDCVGSPYCMEEEDVVALKILNQKRSASTQCTEDQFEEVMSYFEDIADQKHKYAYVDNTPILSFEELQKDPLFKEKLNEPAQAFAEDIYEHWSARRMKSGNRHVLPELKFETNQDSDDGDPYVCFRRREVRQARKTRQRDSQSVQKLQGLAREVGDARTMVTLHFQKMLAEKEKMRVDRSLYEQRKHVKDMKRKLKITGDDEDLINQKPKKKIVDPSQLGTRMAPAHMRFPQRPAHSAEDLQSLEDIQADKENEIRRDIQTKVAQHSQWNKGYVDQTRNPLTPTSQRSFSPGFRQVGITLLPTPPPSVSSQQSSDVPVDVESPSPRERETVRYSSPSEDSSNCAFRLRTGRGNRQWVDRKMSRGQFDMSEIDQDVQDRFKFDHEDDDEDLVLDIDNYDPFSMRYRAHLFDRAREAAAQAQAQAQAARRAHSDANGQSGALVAAGNAHPSHQPSGT